MAKADPSRRAPPKIYIFLVASYEKKDLGNDTWKQKSMEAEFLVSFPCPVSGGLLTVPAYNHQRAEEESIVQRTSPPTDQELRQKHMTFSKLHGFRDTAYFG
ncbi:hypothetical protein TNCV_2971641 [Trichonephila clavipes]|nr:hypothetical protein TNCV_2971641 [Trichonephila clavipes]